MSRFSKNLNCFNLTSRIGFWKNKSYFILTYPLCTLHRLLVSKQLFLSKLLVSDMVIKKFYELFRNSITQVLSSLVPVKVGGVRREMMTELQTLFKEHCVVPDVINIPPSELLTVKYPNGSIVSTGKELTPTQVKDQPVVQWAAKDEEYYTLAMVDPDAPSREEPKFREWHHWLVGNIHGGHIGKGEILSEYIGSGPPKGTGLHRYVFLVYKQPEKCDFSKMPKLRNNSGDKRGKFSIAKFATQYKLGSPIAGNFYLAKYDDYVPKLYAKLKG